MSAPRFEVTNSLGQGVESFEGRKPYERERLSAKEVEPIRYVFSEWDGEAGMGSSAAQLEKLAAMPGLLAKGTVDDARGSQLMERAIESAWRRAWERDGQVMVAHGTAPAFRDTYSAIERWTDSMLRDGKRTPKGLALRRCLASLAELTRRRRWAPMILRALYGDKQPGLLDLLAVDPGRGVLWSKEVDNDYVRVLPFVDGSPPVAQLEETLRLEKKRRQGESESQWRATKAEAAAKRWAIVNDLGRKCEALIVDATKDYRAAWKASA